jgi:hypothetical protein
VDYDTLTFGGVANVTGQIVTDGTLGALTAATSSPGT